jgi:hypothetical protein
MSLDPHISECDQRILDITRELCIQLDITNYNPTFISWETLDSRSRRPIEFRYDECLIEKYCLTLSAKMKDVLEPDEWKPIIASSLIFSKKLRNRIYKGFILSLATFVALALFLFFELPILLPQPYTASKSGASQTSALGYFIAGPLDSVLVLFGPVVVSLTYARRLRRKADTMATDLVSAKAFLATLNKVVDTERATGYTESVNYRGSIPLLPKIRTRISLLEEVSGLASTL